ncbi:hypothetical protein VTK56DRAFT_5668 [Thermocarpiscus australiensis]
MVHSGLSRVVGWVRWSLVHKMALERIPIDRQLRGPSVSRDLAAPDGSLVVIVMKLASLAVLTLSCANSSTLVGRNVSYLTLPYRSPGTVIS